MTQSSGYMFSVKLTSRSVNPGATIAIDTPDASNPNVDKVNWEVAANGYVYVDPAVRVQFGPTFINITNNTGVVWPQHSEVVLCCPYLSDDVDLTPRVAALETQTANHETRITTNANNIAGHETRITTNTTNVATNATNIAAHDTRITALETAVP
jgi:hypothetical protein